MATATFRIWRGERGKGDFKDYETPVSEGMVVLDAVHQIQAEQANDLAVRWNCKAGKCGSCSAEVNGMPKLMCMTRLSDLDLNKPVTVQPMQTFPSIRDLVTDVSWNFRVKKEIKPFKPRKPDAPDGTWRMQQEDIERVQEFRKCIECFLCQDVCHVLRDHHKHDEFIGPRFLVHTAALEMHPLDTEDRDPGAEARRTASATATSRSAARRSVRRASPSRTTRSFRSRSGWSTVTTTRSSGCSTSGASRRQGQSAPPPSTALPSERGVVGGVRRSVVGGRGVAQHAHGVGVSVAAVDAGVHRVRDREVPVAHDRVALAAADPARRPELQVDRHRFAAVERDQDVARAGGVRGHVDVVALRVRAHADTVGLVRGTGRAVPRQGHDPRVIRRSPSR